MPPTDWGVGTHGRHLRNLYVYFWRWATWKVFDQDPTANTGVICFITVAGFLSNPGFQKMRDYLRRTADSIWVIDCSPDGHQPPISTRIFQGVQQAVCIMLVCRSHSKSPDTLATVEYTALPEGDRETKIDALARLRLIGKDWTSCPSESRAPFLPIVSGAWATFPALEFLFAYSGTGVMSGRTWIIAPDKQSLETRWRTLIRAKPEKKEGLFHPHLRQGKPGDRHVQKSLPKGLHGYPNNPKAVAADRSDCLSPLRFGFRSFDRQWIIPDNRLIYQPNPELWRAHSDNQIYLTAPCDRSPSSGPALTFVCQIPDAHHYHGRGGRVFPLWRDAAASEPNIPAKLLEALGLKYGRSISPEELFAYIGGVAANPAYTSRFQKDLAQPGLRIPLTSKAKLFATATDLGRRVIWRHTFGERYVDAKAGRPAGPPRLPKELAPRIPKSGAIPDDPDHIPDEMSYDETQRRLHVGDGYIDNVSPTVWNYEVSGKHVLTQWFNYRKKNRAKPPMGDRRPPSKLGDIQPDHWLAEYTTELLNVLHVLALLVELEPDQAKLLEAICDGTTLDLGR